MHHPPITAVHVSTSDNAYECAGEIEISSKFWGQFLEVVPLGLVQTKFPKHGDHYVWNKVATGVHNVLIGKMWLDQHGELVVKNLSTGDTSRTKFLKPSGKEDSAISGKVGCVALESVLSPLSPSALVLVEYWVCRSLPFGSALGNLLIEVLPNVCGWKQYYPP